MKKLSCYKVDAGIECEHMQYVCYDTHMWAHAICLFEDLQLKTVVELD
jgi:hypothetical protein